LHARFQARGVPALQCTGIEVEEMPETIKAFIIDNDLENVLVSSFLKSLPTEPLRHAIEKAGTGQVAVSWIELEPLLGEQLSSHTRDLAYMTILVNLARLQAADYIGNTVLRSVLRTPKLSRRDLLRSLPNMLKVESDIPIVLKRRCRNRSKSCDYCRRACPVKAIPENGDTVIIDDRLCIECGACARECPIGAIQCLSVSDPQILAMLNALSSERFETYTPTLLLTCPIGFERMRKEGTEGKHLRGGIAPVEIPCIASIGSVHHIWSASLGVNLLTVCPDISCRKTVAVFPIHEHASSSNDILKTLRTNMTTTVHHLNLDARGSMVDSVSRTVTSPLPADGETRLSGASRQDIVLEALRALLAGNGEGGTVLPTGSRLPLFDLKVDDTRCTFCEFCSTHCPDHAIYLMKSENSESLIFDPSLCGGCMICEKNCREQAISLSRLTELSPILERRKIEKVHDENAKCDNCGTSLGSKRNLTALRKKLLDNGVADGIIRALNLCNRCKQEVAIRPLGRQLPIQSKIRIP